MASAAGPIMTADSHELIGYTDPFSAAPGERVDVKVSCDAPGYDAAFVRLLHGDEALAGPGFQEQELRAEWEGEYTGRRQRTSAGSYVHIDDVPALVDFTFGVWICPTVPAVGRRQVIVSQGAEGDPQSWWVALDGAGNCELRIGDGALQTAERLTPDRWVRITAALDLESGRLLLVTRALRPEYGRQEYAVADAIVQPAPGPAGTAPLLLAARLDSQHAAVDHFNGKLEAPVLLMGAVDSAEIVGAEASPPTDRAVIAEWDLGAQPASTVALDGGPRGLNGHIVNRPDRAMTGHLWDGTWMDFRQAPDQYGAIAFHDDDLADAAWQTDFGFTVSADLPSGVYAIRLRAEAHSEDHIPLIVRPPRGRATARVALIIPTFSYLAYANDHVLRLAGRTSKYSAIPPRYDPLDELPERHPEWGGSLYDTHSDGTGVSVSSRLRPIVNLRPRYRWWASGGVQYLASDLYIIHWLHTLGIDIDLLTDEDLHAEGAPLLSGYGAVLTGTHPEYVTAQILDGLDGYLAAGGNLMYLGGNGFYWVTATPPVETNVVEVRRGNAGTRAWESAPGEEHHMFTGERGGLWRHRGRPPNGLVGVGFGSQGWSDPSPGYRRTEASRDPRAAWIFEGVDEDVIGDFGLAMNGAAGDELDRYDVARGSPAHAIVLASSSGHSSYYAIAHEDLMQTTSGITGDTNPNVRADLTYFETAAGGAVFSVGSKSWCASLSWNSYDNSVARISENVLRRFIGDDGVTSLAEETTTAPD